MILVKKIANEVFLFKSRLFIWEIMRQEHSETFWKIRIIEGIGLPYTITYHKTTEVKAAECQHMNRHGKFREDTISYFETIG